MAAKQTNSFASIPFQREKSGHITVVARLSGKPVRFVVDTGAGGTCIHSGLIEKYKLSLTAKTKQGGGAGTFTMKMTMVASHNLSLESVDLSAFKLIAFDLSHVVAGLAKAKVEAIVGVLGADVLHRKHAVIDYARSTILLSR
jgi:Aspartyl protease